jgi:FkbM family methyltransferase
MFKTAVLYFETVGLKGLVRAIASKLIGGQSLLRVTKTGCRFPFWLRLPSSDVPTYKQVFIDREYDFSVVKNPSTIIDAGANIGLASIWFANKFPDAIILAIEPENSNFELLKKNLAMYPNVIPIRAALWSTEGLIRLTDPGIGNWGFRTKGMVDSEDPIMDSEHLVNAVTVESLIKLYKLERVSILKIDIEGAEKEVFSESANWIGSVDSIIIELHDRFKEGCSDVFHSSTIGFSKSWRIGENVYVSRDNCLRAPVVDS